MAKKGGKTSQFYTETRGLKTSGGQTIKAGAMLTRQGSKWKPGINVIGADHLTSACDGEVYFTRKKSSYRQIQTVINVRPSIAKIAVASKVKAAQDDLKIVEGIGPKYAEALNKAGITTFAQLAKMSQDQIKNVVVKAKMKVPASIATWVEQAKLGAAGKMDELKKLQDELNAGRRE